MRKVKVFKYDVNLRGKVVDHDSAKFHCFGVDYEEMNDGNITYSIAIVELDNGAVIMPRADYVQFLLENP